MSLTSQNAGPSAPTFSLPGMLFKPASDSLQAALPQDYLAQIRTSIKFFQDMGQDFDAAQLAIAVGAADNSFYLQAVEIAYHLQNEQRFLEAAVIFGMLAGTKFSGPTVADLTECSAMNYEHVGFAELAAGNEPAAADPFRNAAGQYEKAGSYQRAYECYLHAGESEPAAQARIGSFQSAMEALVQWKQHEPARAKDIDALIAELRLHILEEQKLQGQK